MTTETLCFIFCAVLFGVCSSAKNAGVPVPGDEVSIEAGCDGGFQGCGKNAAGQFDSIYVFSPVQNQTVKFLLQPDPHPDQVTKNVGYNATLITIAGHQYSRNALCASTPTSPPFPGAAPASHGLIGSPIAVDAFRPLVPAATCLIKVPTAADTGCSPPGPATAFNIAVYPVSQTTVGGWVTKGADAKASTYVEFTGMKGYTYTIPNFQIASSTIDQWGFAIIPTSPFFPLPGATADGYYSVTDHVFYYHDLLVTAGTRANNATVQPLAVGIVRCTNFGDFRVIGASRSASGAASGFIELVDLLTNTPFASVATKTEADPSIASFRIDGTLGATQWCPRFFRVNFRTSSAVGSPVVHFLDVENSIR